MIKRSDYLIFLITHHELCAFASIIMCYFVYPLFVTIFKVALFSKCIGIHNLFKFC